MAVNQLVAHVIAVGLAGHGAVIAGAEDALVFNQDAADQGPVASRPLGDNQGLHHKVLLPRDACPGHLLAPVLKVVKADSVADFVESLVGNFVSLLGPSN